MSRSIKSTVRFCHEQRKEDRSHHEHEHPSHHITSYFIRYSDNCKNRMAQYSTAEAKKEFFLTTDDLRDLPKQSIYCGFGTGPPMKVYDENDLEEAALSKHGRAGLAKKRAAREKRESNKRKREEEAAAAVDPAVAERNAKIVGRKWDLQITSPESVAGTKAELVFGCLPPTGWPGKSSRQNISQRCFSLI